MVEAKGKENGTVFVAETTYGVTKFPLLHDKIEEDFTNLWKVKIFKPVERAAIRPYAVSLLLFFQRRILVAVRELIPDYKTKEEAKNQNLVSSCWLNISHTLKERSWESLSESLTFGGLLFKAARIPIANFDLLGATFFNVWTDTPSMTQTRHFFHVLVSPNLLPQNSAGEGSSFRLLAVGATSARPADSTKPPRALWRPSRERWASVDLDGPTNEESTQIDGLLAMAIINAFRGLQSQRKAHVGVKRTQFYTGISSSIWWAPR